MITVTIPSFNNIIFAKEKKYFTYIIWRFSFFSSCEKNVFISDQLAAEMKITSTWHVQNEWMNELWSFWSEISTTVKTLLRNKLTLVYAILGSFLPDTEQRLLFCSLHFEENDFLVPGLRVWAVTSAVMAWFSRENIFGLDIPAEARKR